MGTRFLAMAVLAGSALGAIVPAHAALVISNAATKNVNCAADVCTATAKNAVLNASQLETMLGTSDATVNTGGGAVTIGITSPLTWASTSRLTLNASQGVSVKAAVVVEGTGAITIAAAGGALNFYPGGSIDFWDNTSSLIIGGHSYTLVSDLATLASKIGADSSGYYALAKNHDASGETYSDAVVTGTLDGTFEGLGNTISNLDMNPFDPTTVGLFSEVSTTGIVRDFVLEASMDCDPADNAAYEAGLVAGENNGQIRNIVVSGSISCIRARDAGGAVGDNIAPGMISNVVADVGMSPGKMHYVGGLAGANSGTILNSSASGSVAGASAGGLVGWSTGTVQDSHASGHVSNSNGYDLGGLAGIASGTIRRCFATGTINGRKLTGGLVGSAGSLTIDSSFATGSASGLLNAGGLVGGTGNASVVVINSYARGASTATSPKAGYAGGLVGSKSFGSMTTSYSTGAPNGAKDTGGTIGHVVNAPTMTNIYWDLDTSGISDPSKAVGNQANYPGIAGLTDAQLKSGLPSGFDPAIWGQSPGINDGYPYLLANPPPQ